MIEKKYDLTENIISSSNNLKKLLIDKGASLLVDIEEAVECKNKIDELKRLIGTLEQYSTKSHSLEYIGFVGHFSSGKSSTTNSLLKIWNTKGQRATDLHPTDDSVTLTTHKNNSHKLLGTHRKGELKVGSQYVNVDSLKDRVLVDTPGSGDPGIIEEMVRDFLPICDHIIYVFSATTPLDTNDIPILKKSHEELPFIPIKFIVTRANEFIKDRKVVFSKENIDIDKINKFTSELIARLQQIVPDKRFIEEDFLFVDNLDKYNTEKLEDFIFDSSQKVKDLHSHKIQYFISNIKEVRDFFKVYTYEQIQSLNKLVHIAASNHEKYKKSFLMGKSDLTENWRDIYEEIHQRSISQETKIKKLREDVNIPLNINQITFIKEFNISLENEIRMQLDIYVNTILESIERMLDSMVSKIKIEAKNIINNNSIDSIDVSELKDIEFDDYKFRGESVPQYLLFLIESLKSGLKSNLDDYESNIINVKKYILSVTNNNSNLKKEEKVTLKSQKELGKILENFYSHVALYKGAILAIDAIGIAEKLRLGNAIDELNNVELNDDYKNSINDKVRNLIYSDRVTHIETYKIELSRIRENVAKVTIPPSITQTEYYDNDSSALVTELKNKVESHINDNRLKKVVKEQAISEIHSIVINLQKQCRDNIIEEKKSIRKRAWKRILGAVLLGSSLGLVVILIDNSFISKIPFVNTIITNNLGASILTELVFIFFTTGFAWMFNKLKKGQNKNLQDIPEIKKSELISSIDQVTFNKKDIMNSQSTTIQSLLEKHWRSIAKNELEKAISRNQNYFDDLRNNSVLINDAIDNYQKSSLSFLNRATDFYNDPKSNLEVLADVSHEIKDAAIEPSFIIFKDRQVQLNDFYEELKSVEFV